MVFTNISLYITIFSLLFQPISAKLAKTLCAERSAAGHKTAYDDGIKTCIFGSKTTAPGHEAAMSECEKFEAYLAMPLTRRIFKMAQTAKPNDHSRIGFKQINATTENEPNNGWALTAPNGVIQYIGIVDVLDVDWLTAAGVIQPSGTPLQNCLTLLYGKFNDADCTSTWHYICQYRDCERQYKRLAKLRAPTSMILEEHSNINQPFKCIFLCGDSPFCVSFSYKQITGHCILQMSDAYNAKTLPISAEGYYFYTD